MRKIVLFPEALFELRCRRYPKTSRRAPFCAAYRPRGGAEPASTPGPGPMCWRDGGAHLTSGGAVVFAANFRIHRNARTEAGVLAAGSSGRPEVRAGLAETAFTHDRNRLSASRPSNSGSCWCTRVAFGTVRLVALSAPAAVYAEGRKLADHPRARRSGSRSNGCHQAAIAGRGGVCMQPGGRRCT